MASISFCWFISVVITSRTLLNKSGKSRPPCIVPDFRGKTFSFSALRMMLASFLKRLLKKSPLKGCYNYFSSSLLVGIYCFQSFA